MPIIISTHQVQTQELPVDICKSLHHWSILCVDPSKLWNRITTIVQKQDEKVLTRNRAKKIAPKKKNRKIKKSQKSIEHCNDSQTSATNILRWRPVCCPRALIIKISFFMSRKRALYWNKKVNQIETYYKRPRRRPRWAILGNNDGHHSFGQPRHFSASKCKLIWVFSKPWQATRPQGECTARQTEL